VRIIMLLLAAAISGWCADATLWGPVESGLRLGIDVTATSEPALRISLKNVGTEPRDLLIGYEGDPDQYNVEFTTRAPEQQPLPVLDLNASLPPSLLLPITARLRPGEVREFIYPLTKLICVVNRKDVPFRLLLEQSYTVRASFGFPGVTLTTPDWPVRH
jgi:hypothetical protein